MDPGTQRLPCAFRVRRNKPGQRNQSRLLASAVVATLCGLLLPSAFGQSHWAVKASNSSSSLNAVVFGNGLFVAVGDGGVIVTSPDGEAWTPRASGSTDRLPAVAFGNGRFVATRANRTTPAITSADGVNWSPVIITDSSGAVTDSGAWDAIAFGGGRFLAVGSGTSNNSTEIISSADGISFQKVNYSSNPPAGDFGTPFKKIIFFRGAYYASAIYAGVLSSVDGLKWTKRDDWGGYFGSVAPSLATDGISRVSVVSDSNYVSFSVDAGHTFQRGNQPVDRAHSRSNVFRALCYGAGLFVAVDASSGIWTSERGEYWLVRGYYGNAGEEFRGVAFGEGGRFVAVGSAPTGGQALIAVASPDPTPTPPAYTVYSLRALSNGVFNGEPRSISNSGIIGGTITTTGNKSIGAIFRDGAVATYPDPVYGSYPTMVTSVNDNGSAALEVNVGYPYALGIALPQNSRPFPEPGIYSTAPAINASGIIAGAYFNYGFTERGIYRFDSNTGLTTRLGNFGLGGINVSSVSDQGDIAGVYFAGSDPKTNGSQMLPYRVSAGGQLTLIPTLGGKFVWNALTNSAGQVAGSSSLPDAPTIINATHAFLFKDGITSDIDLLNSRFSRVNGINNKGDVVGEFTPANRAGWQSVDGNAFLYRDGVMYDLNGLLDASGDAWLLYRATSINDKGWIVGQGWLHGPNLEPFLAMPAVGRPAGTQTRFVNVSTRLRTSTGDDALIAGFILRGGPKRVILRALGPGLRNLGNPAASPPDLLADPTLELFNDRGERVAYNDNFTDLPHFPDQNEIGLFGLSPPYGGSVTADSVIAATLPEGSYTAVVRGKNGTSGTCLVEAYNVDTDYSPGLLNISTRGPVGTGDNVMIAGIIIRGDRERRVLIRGVGPSLAAAGVAKPLPDPTLEIHDANGQIAQNDNWKSDQENEIRAAGFAPGDERDAAVILSLWPGNYTAILRGKGSDTGNSLVEVYTLPD
ncbi:MAG: hypothetical protein QOI07_86 [Verrucomicrobiota bacterium]